VVEEAGVVKGREDPGRVLILGCGPTGCGAAWRLEEAGHHDYEILEAASGPGGLAASTVDDAGFTWDLGGHVQFSHYRYYDRVLDTAVTDGWLWHERDSSVWIDGRLVPYPLQYNLHRLAPALRDRLLDGLRRASTLRDRVGEARSLAEWIERAYGRPLAERFLFPYNAKVWGHSLDDMGWGWIGDRLAAPDLLRIERNVRESRDDASWGPNVRFRYPEHGGTGRIWTSIAGRLGAERIRFGCRVRSIDARRRLVRLESGEVETYDTVVSTMPLDALVGITEALPAAVMAAARSLRYSSVHVVGVGLKGGRPAKLRTKCWIYFPEEASPYYRVTLFSNYSPHLVPEGEGLWSLMAEVCESPLRRVDTALVRTRVLESMKRDGLIGADAAIASLWHRRLERGYPTPTIARDQALAVLHPALERLRIFSRGRFGGWKYEVSNQDHSFMQGVELVDRLTLGAPEVTYPHPTRANSGEFLAGDEGGPHHSDHRHPAPR
jgi:protoporphyrinogen oxidase